MIPTQSLDGSLSFSPLDSSFNLKRLSSTGFRSTVALWVYLGAGISGVKNLFSANLYTLEYNSTQKRLRLQYGTSFNWVQLVTPTDSIQPDTWTQIQVTYTGGQTGVASGSVSTYYNQFKIYINGAQMTTSASNANFGYNGSNIATTASFGSTGIKTASVAIWSAVRNQTGILNAYNSGKLIDYMTLGVTPRYYWYFKNSDVQQAGVNLGETITGTFSSDTPPDN